MIWSVENKHTISDMSGNLIKGIYLPKATYGNYVLAVIRNNENEYYWVWNYNFKNGTWGRGHYGFSTLKSAVADLKHHYPYTRRVDGDLYEVVNESGDSFGWYTNLKMASKRLYHVAKRYKRTWVATPDGRRFNYTIISANGIRKMINEYNHVYRLYADGSTKEM